jgi:hypothetical protein
VPFASPDFLQLRAAPKAAIRVLPFATPARRSAIGMTPKRQHSSSNLSLVLRDLSQSTTDIYLGHSIKVKADRNYAGARLLHLLKILGQALRIRSADDDIGDRSRTSARCNVKPKDNRQDRIPDASPLWIAWTTTWYLATNVIMEFRRIETRH